jgi:hypothetical protein
MNSQKEMPAYKYDARAVSKNARLDVNRLEDGVNHRKHRLYERSIKIGISKTED